MLRLTITVNRESDEEQTGARALSNFVNAIRSPATRKVYEQSLRRYMNHLKIASVDSLLESTQPKLIESQLIDYVMYLRNDGIAYATIQSLIAPLFTFYQLNDVVLNRKKVQRYLGEYRRVVRDKVYTNEQLLTALPIFWQYSHVLRCSSYILITQAFYCSISSRPLGPMPVLLEVAVCILLLSFYCVILQKTCLKINNSQRTINN
jgi:hypothetical protein